MRPSQVPRAYRRLVLEPYVITPVQNLLHHPSVPVHNPRHREGSAYYRPFATGTVLARSPRVECSRRASVGEACRSCVE